MGIYATKSRWQGLLKPLVALCVRHEVHPDLFTYGALALSFVAGFALTRAGPNHLWLWLVPPAVLLRLLFNLLDGMIARETGIADTWGEVKNEFGDRVADSAIFLGLAFGGYADARLVALVLALVLSGSYLGLFGKALGGPRIYGGLFGKGDRMLSLALFTLYPLFTGNLPSYNWYLAAAMLAASVTIFQRLRVLYAQQSVR
ncbi:MAG TPA: CDP-alcohol phosphatidyltransferase family protein [Ardenticatenaceae bacterium]|jgi:CDP-diacylglycerol--glycerol-3-phosphate 3-phosphatidyltransferase